MSKLQKNKTHFLATGPKKAQFFEGFQIYLPKTKLFDPCTSLNFFELKKNCANYIDPSGHSLMKLCVARTFLVELHLVEVLEVLQVVGSKLLFYKPIR